MYSNTQNIKVNKFDSIRPYLDNEVNKVLVDLSNNRRFLKMLFKLESISISNTYHFQGRYLAIC